ncbi:ATP-binding protein [Pseudomonas sp. B329]|uniref:ATP-binding protein n=1 Tax=Pseudomonas sp. B329 TaxID=1553459 RepID=UPI0020038B44|nr:ATP-binding protein [Pseudomonas sp. B329]MCK3863832.1 HAMP domain-containing protein [Pseudomonas sp. B329]
MKRIWQRSLAARFILLLLLALVVSQGVGFLISWDERDQGQRASSKAEFFSRTASLALLLDSTPTALGQDILLASGTNFSRFWISPDASNDASTWWSEARAHLIEPLPYEDALSDQRECIIDVKSPPAETLDGPRLWSSLSAQTWPIPTPARYLALEPLNGWGLAVPLADGSWLNAVYSKSTHHFSLTSQSLLTLTITAFALSLIAIVVARGITRPMRHLAAAAELLGRGETVPPLAESGPDDIRQTAEAFNRMQARIQRFIEDRIRILAAIGHDLRTPITSLRLRAEFVTDPDIQEKLLVTIEEIRSLTETAITYAREEAPVEPTRAVDVCALVESLCDDLAELGLVVSYSGGPKTIYRCRPDALRRALRNLIENAVRYGERARVSISYATSSLDIIVEDDGPGIPEIAHEQVFSPFFRLESSRSLATGGVGLGLSIARAIARHHGGDISLNNLQSGMRAVLTLPINH